jgi:hypothetical protein
VSFLTPRVLTLLETAIPDWQTRPLPEIPPSTSPVWDRLRDCHLRTWGDLASTTPLTALALIAGDPWVLPTEVGALWPIVLEAAYAQLRPGLTAALAQLLAKTITLPRPPHDVAPATAAADRVTMGAPDDDGGFSALFLYPDLAVAACLQDYLPDRVTLDLPTGTLQVSRGGEEIAGATLLAPRVWRALLDAGCPLTDMTLDTLGLGSRAANCLGRVPIQTVDDLVHLTPDQLFGIRNFGVKSYAEVTQRLREVLMPWLRALPLECFLPAPTRPQAVDDDNCDASRPAQVRPAPSPADQPASKSALFFPLERVLSLTGRPDVPPTWRETTELTPQDMAVSPLLSQALIELLASLGCDARNISSSTPFTPHFGLATAAVWQLRDALVRAGLRSVGDVLSQTPAQLLPMRAIGSGGYGLLIKRLRMFLVPWLDQLRSAARVEEEQGYPVATHPRQMLAPLRQSALLPLLDHFETQWRGVPLSEAAPHIYALAHDALPPALTLGDMLADRSVHPGPMLMWPAGIALDEVTHAIAEFLIGRLVAAALSPSADEVLAQAESAQFGSITVASLLAELMGRSQAQAATGERKRDEEKVRTLLMRHGVFDGRRRTLTELGDQLGITRERVRQITVRAETRMLEPSLAPFTRGLTAVVVWAVRELGGIAHIHDMADKIATWLPFGELDPCCAVELFAGWAPEIVSDGDVLTLSAVSHSSAGPAENAAQREASWVRHARQMSLAEQATRALRDLGRPATGQEIADRVQASYGHATSSERTIQAILARHPTEFVAVGRGLYTLAEKGTQSHPSASGRLRVADVVAGILAASAVPLHRTDLLALGTAKSGWAENSLSASLGTDPRFLRLGKGFYGLADREYPNFDAAQAHTNLFGRETPVKEQLLAGIYDNERGHPVVQIKLSASCIKHGIPLLAQKLSAFLPELGVYRTETVGSGGITRVLELRRTNAYLSGLRAWLEHAGARQGDMLFIERITEPSPPAFYALRLACAPEAALEEARRVVGLADAALQSASVRRPHMLRHVRRARKLVQLVTFTGTHPWTPHSKVAAALGFAGGEAQGDEYIELGVQGGLLAEGVVAGRSTERLVRPTLSGRKWLRSARAQDAKTALRSVLLTIPSYRAHLRGRLTEHLEQHRPSSADQSHARLMDTALAERWDERLGLTQPDEITGVIASTPALIHLARLDPAAMALILVLALACSHAFGVDKHALADVGVLDIEQAIASLRQLGIEIAESGDRVALGEPVALAITAYAGVAHSLQALPAPLRPALTHAWESVMRGGSTRDGAHASDLYSGLLDADGRLLSHLATPLPDGLAQVDEEYDASLVSTGFTPLAGDWGWHADGRAEPPFAFLADAIERMAGRDRDTVGVCLCDDLLAQPWETPHALAANAHLALLTLAAADTGTLAERITRHDAGWMLGSAPLVLGLDAVLRQLGYDVWDDHYSHDAVMQFAIGHQLVACGERFGMFQPDGHGLACDSHLAGTVYYGAYDIVLKMQQLLSTGAP